MIKQTKLRVRIISVDDYTSRTRQVQVGEEYEVVNTLPPAKKDGHISHLIYPHSGQLPIVMYENQVERLTDEVGRPLN